MRKMMEEQSKFGEIDISEIEIDLESRDDIPRVLLGLQSIYNEPDLYNKLQETLADLTPKDVSTDLGRGGMTYWQILVLGVLRLVCDCDFDRLREMANDHGTIRLMLGISPQLEAKRKFGLQTIKDNISKFTPEILCKVNQAVVKYGQAQFGNEKEIMTRCDSFVVKTDVHFPTDINLLFDAMRKVIVLIERACSCAGYSDWRQSAHNTRKIKQSYRKAQKLKHSTSKKPEKQKERAELIKEAYINYLDVCEQFLKKSVETEKKIRDGKSLGGFIVDVEPVLAEVQKFHDHANRQIDQVRRRVLEGEKIPHDEKVFSIFEEHTEWISKGKAGVPQELGLRVSIVEDQNGFIIFHKVMIQETDDKVAVSIIENCKEIYPELVGCSFDKGYYTPDNRDKLLKILEKLTMPRKGKLSKKDQETEYSEEFKERRRQHSAVESAIHALQNHGMSKCRDKGLEAFERYVALGVLGRNIEILGAKVQKKLLKTKDRKEKYNATRKENLSNAA